MIIKKAKILMIILVLLFIHNYIFLYNKFSIVGLKDDYVLIMDDNSSEVYTLEDVINEMFDDVILKKSEYLYSLDEIEDFIYVEFENGGYAVFFKETMELLECSMQGIINYPNTASSKYYVGPNNYFFKSDNKYINVQTNEIIDFDIESVETYLQEFRLKMLSKANNLSESLNFEFHISNSKLLIETNDIQVRSVPGYDEGNIIRLNTGTYIANYDYFANNPKHGHNTNKTCGAVAAQLLLSYHNYYSDRRIIANNYLNGGINEPEKNPNLCTDPMTMNSFTLGTRGYDEDGLDDENSYFYYVCQSIPPKATTSQVKSGINSILSNRNNEITGSINYSLIDGFGNGLLCIPVDSNDIIEEINDGRPVIILMQYSFGGTDHYSVGYGYESYTYPGTTDSYLGYIVNMGWNSHYNNVWINSSWCYSYISLHVSHTHNYYNYGMIGNSNRMEQRCSICGHRTDSGINMQVDDRYIEKSVSIPSGKFHDYYVTFNTTGNKLFQTFGSLNAVMYLYDNEYNFLAGSDDNGYYQNSLFTYYAYSNTPYILRLKFFDSSTNGNLKFSITPVASNYDYYYDIYNICSTNYTYLFTTQLNSSNVLTFTPPQSGTYECTTNYRTDDPLDMYLCLINPESTSSCLYDDDSGGDYQASITTYLSENITYYIVCSTYDISLESGPASLNIVKLY